MAKSASSYSISKRADGRFVAKFMVDGKTTAVYGKTKTEVTAKLKAKLAAVEQAKAAQLTNFMEAYKMTVENWAYICLETYSKVSVRETTYTNYKSLADHHLFPLGKYKLSEVTNAMVQDHLQREARKTGKEDGLGKKSLTNLKAFLNLIFNQKVTAPKTKSSVRDIYIFPSFKKEFEEYKQKMIEWKAERRFVHSEEDFVFVGEKNRPKSFL